MQASCSQRRKLIQIQIALVVFDLFAPGQMTEEQRSFRDPNDTLLIKNLFSPGCQVVTVHNVSLGGDAARFAFEASQYIVFPLCMHTFYY